MGKSARGYGHQAGEDGAEEQTGQATRAKTDGELPWEDGDEQAARTPSNEAEREQHIFAQEGAFEYLCADEPSKRQAEPESSCDRRREGYSNSCALANRSDDPVAETDLCRDVEKKLQGHKPEQDLPEDAARPRYSLLWLFFNLFSSRWHILAYQ